MIKVSEILSTVFYIGKLPMAPGTWCSFIAFLSWYFLSSQIEGVFNLYASLVLFFVGVAVTTIYSESIVEEDPPEIVIDEWVGQWLAFSMLPVTFQTGLIGFIAFRFFDILKPGPVKRMERLPNGLGVMADDIMAGILAYFIIIIYYLLF